VIKLVLVVLVLLIAIPLFRRSTGKRDGQPDPKKKDDDPGDGQDDDVPPAKPDFSALMRTVVLLEDNDWATCTFDGIKEDWSRFTSEPVRGFCTISAGRHRASTKVGDREAVVDFVLRPGGFFARRLDREKALWVPLEGAALERARRDAEGGETGSLGEALIRYRSTLGVARAMSGKLSSPEAAFEKAKAELSEIAKDEPSLEVDARARAIGESLVGVPLLEGQLEALSAIVASNARLRELVLPT
jgi:hypothetical protein